MIFIEDNQSACYWLDREIVRPASSADLFALWPSARWTDCQADFGLGWFPFAEYNFRSTSPVSPRRGGPGHADGDQSPAPV